MKHDTGHTEQIYMCHKCYEQTRESDILVIRHRDMIGKMHIDLHCPKCRSQKLEVVRL